MKNNEVTVCSGYVEYKMSETMAKEYLKSSKIKDGYNTKRGQAYLCDIVNKEFGLKGICVKVLVN